MKKELLLLVNDTDKAFNFIVDSILDFGLYASKELLEITDKFQLGEKLHNNDIYNLIEELKNIPNEVTEEEVKPLHRFRVRSIEMILNNIKDNGFASVFYPYNYIRDIKQHYGINLKVDECHRIVYDK